MYKLEYFKADGTQVKREFHTRKSATHEAKRVGVAYAYITDPEGNRVKVRFDGLKDDVNPDTLRDAGRRPPLRNRRY